MERDENSHSAGFIKAFYEQELYISKKFVIDGIARCGCVK